MRFKNDMEIFIELELYTIGWSFTLGAISHFINERLRIFQFEV